MSELKIQDIIDLEQAKTLLARCIVDKKNLEVEKEKVFSVLKALTKALDEAEILVMVNLGSDRIDKSIRLYNQKKDTIGNATEILGDTRTIDASLFEENIVSVKCKINLHKLIRG